MLLQDWTTIEGPGTDAVVQSAPNWLNLEGYRDAIFWLEVGFITAVNTELNMNYETAPANDPTLFTAMVPEFLITGASATPVVTKVLLSQNPACPVAGLVRWRLRQNAGGTWRITFRITCMGKWKG